MEFVDITSRELLLVILFSVPGAMTCYICLSYLGLRTRTAGELRKSEERLRQIVENVREVVFLIDHPNDKILYVSPSVHDVFGQTWEGPNKQPYDWLDAVHPEDLERVTEALQKRMITGEFEEVFRIIRPDGSVRWILERVVPIQNELGEVHRLVGVAEDITERKQAEELSKVLSSSLESEAIQGAVLRCALGALNGDVAALLLPANSDLRGSWTLLVNASGIDGIAGAEQIKEPLVNGMQAMSSRFDQSSEIQTIIGRDTVAEHEIPGLETAKLESLMCLPLIFGGEVIGMVGVGSKAPGQFNSRHLGFLSTTANQAAVALNNTRLFRQTILEKQRLEKILGNMADGLLLLDDNNRVVNINPALERILGIEAESFVGLIPSEVPSGTGLTPLADLCTALSSGKLDASTSTKGVDEKEVTLHSPTNRVLRLTSSVVADSAGRESGKVVIVHDVTREKELDQMKSDFLSNTSHELRTPLHSIKGFLKLLRSDKVPDPQTRKEFLDTIFDQSERLGVLIDDLLDIHRLESGNFIIKKQRTSLNEVIDNTVTELYGLANESGITLVQHIPTGLPEMKVDELRIKQVMTNLIHNAIKFSTQKGTVAVAASASDIDFLFQVTDQGIGIPEEDIPHIFERFYRVDNSMTRNTAGSGLGLCVSKQIIEAHGGRIWAESTLGQGSTLSFTVPLVTCSDGN